MSQCEKHENIKVKHITITTKRLGRYHSLYSNNNNNSSNRIIITQEDGICHSQ